MLLVGAVSSEQGAGGVAVVLTSAPVSRDEKSASESDDAVSRRLVDRQAYGTLEGR
jgi:hypothetical protein